MNARARKYGAALELLQEMIKGRREIFNALCHTRPSLRADTVTLRRRLLG
jgi:hypothetical protein